MEAEAKLQVRVEHTALGIINRHGIHMVGVEIISRCIKNTAKASVACVNADIIYAACVTRSCLHGVEVDGALCSAVRTTEVENKLIINEYPQVIVTGEVKGLSCAVLIQAVFIQRERNLQLHTKAEVVSIVIGGIGITVGASGSVGNVDATITPFSIISRISSPSSIWNCIKHFAICWN